MFNQQIWLNLFVNLFVIFFYAKNVLNIFLIWHQMPKMKLILSKKVFYIFGEVMLIYSILFFF